MHSILFDGCENGWKNALPLGNGVFGAMAYFRDNELSLPMNHYEVYYNISDAVLPEDILASTPHSNNPGREHIARKDMADANQPKNDEPFYYYRIDKRRPLSDFSGGFSGSYPATGNLAFELSESLKGEKSKLSLDIEDAVVRLSVGKLSLDALVLRKDAVSVRVRGGGIDAIRLDYPDSRDRDFPDVEYKQINDNTFSMEVKIALSEKKNFRFAVIMKLIGTSGTLRGSRITLSDNEDFTFITGVFTDWRYKSPLSDGLSEMDKYCLDLHALYKEHSEYWHEFFDRGRISIPDKFLERCYYVNQYALDASSGRDGVMKHHACGLNGLWDIKHPTLWGSMWYWDVNIQAAFAGTFSSNRLELGKTFSDGLLTYVELAKRFAKDEHGLDGAAIDYPYSFYYCVWPWCAGYLWAQYEYSGDVEYLKNEAYPLFIELCKFTVKLFEFDESRSVYTVYPDISPEQGPLTHNSVSTIASVKYMLKFTLKAAEILGDDNEILPEVRRLLQGLPSYATAEDAGGTRFIDSEDAPPDMWIRHPGMLMPIYPCGEIDKDSSEELIAIAKNTIAYLEKNCEIGVFQVSWLAAAAARIGDGNTALRLIYEMGLDHLLRSNGLAAEENERFMNFCLIMRQPLYYPCMMEFTGEMLAAVNEMLMQSSGDAISIFPAIPTKDNPCERLKRDGRSLDVIEFACNTYPEWRCARFDRLLARGGFEVSAELSDGKVKWIKITSKLGGKVRITSPFDLTNLASECVTVNGNVLEFDTAPGGAYIFGNYTEFPESAEGGVVSHLSLTKRRVFIGGDGNTDYYKAIDGFIRDWYLGNVRMENHTVYKFDFGYSYEKNYREDILPQFFGAEKMILKSMNFIRLDELDFTTRRGYGFINSFGINRVDNDGPDAIRRDLLEGEECVEFVFDAPEGQYEMLVISGDEREDSVTLLDAPEGRRCGGEVVSAGKYQCKIIPVIHEREGLIRLRISTVSGYKWKLNAIILNLYKQF